MRFEALIALAAPVAVQGAVHRMFVGNLYPPASIYALQFDDQSLELKMTKNITANSGHAWIALNVSPLRRKRLWDPDRSDQMHLPA